MVLYGWYVYSQDIKEAEEGPLPTLFTFDKNEAVEFLSEKPEEISDHKKDDVDAVFKMRVKKYGKEVIFRQKVKMAEGTPITGNFRYMTCDDSRCLFPQPEEFAFNKKEEIVDAATQEKIKKNIKYEIYNYIAPELAKLKEQDAEDEMQMTPEMFDQIMAARKQKGKSSPSSDVLNALKNGRNNQNNEVLREVVTESIEGMSEEN